MARASNPNRGAKPGERRGGRQKGSQNVMTRDLKNMILGALDEAGGVKYLVRQAEANPAAFMTLVGKVLPLTVAGDPDNPLKAVTIVELVAPKMLTKADEKVEVLANPPVIEIVHPTEWR